MTPGRLETVSPLFQPFHKRDYGLNCLRYAIVALVCLMGIKARGGINEAIQGTLISVIQIGQNGRCFGFQLGDFSPVSSFAFVPVSLPFPLAIPGNQEFDKIPNSPLPCRSCGMFSVANGLLSLPIFGQEVPNNEDNKPTSSPRNAIAQDNFWSHFISGIISGIAGAITYMLGRAILKKRGWTA